MCKQSKSRFCTYSCYSESFEAMKEFCPPPRKINSQWLAGAGAKLVAPKEKCTICLDTPQPGLAIVTHCNHYFCATCYQDWADAQAMCIGHILLPQLPKTCNLYPQVRDLPHAYVLRSWWDSNTCYKTVLILKRPLILGSKKR